MSIIVSGALRPSTTNTPLDERCRIAELSDAANIELPYLGMIFYCVATGKHYKVTALKSRTVGAFPVADGAIDTVEALPAMSDIPAPAEEPDPSAEQMVFDVSGLSVSDRASLIVELSSDPEFPAAAILTRDSAVSADNSCFRVWGGQTLSDYPSGGINSVYNGGQIVFTVPRTASGWTAGHIHYRYYFRSEAGDTLGSCSSMRYGCLRSVTHPVNLSDLGFGSV